jgi:hypothetical protein
MFEQDEIGRQMNIAESPEQADNENRRIQTDAAGPSQAARQGDLLQVFHDRLHAARHLPRHYRIRPSSTETAQNPADGGMDASQAKCESIALQFEKFIIKCTMVARSTDRYQGSAVWNSSFI